MSERQELSIGSPAAARVVWNPRAASGVQASARTRRGAVQRKALIQSLVGAVAGAVLFHFGRHTLAYVAFVIASLMLATALISPLGLHARLTRWIEAFGRQIGKLFTWILLVPFFFLFFTLFGRALRSGKRDKLERRFDRSAESYWRQRPVKTPALSDYERQF